MKKVLSFFFCALMVVGLAQAKPPKVKESNFGKESYRQSLIDGYGLEKQNSEQKLSKNIHVYDFYKNENGDYLEYAVHIKNGNTITYVGTFINGEYKSRTSFEHDFGPEYGKIEAVTNEDTNGFTSGGSNGTAQITEAAEGQYYMNCVSFRSDVRESMKTPVPDNIKHKDYEMLGKLKQFFSQNGQKSEKDWITLYKDLKEINKKYKK